MWTVNGMDARHVAKGRVVRHAPRLLLLEQISRWYGTRKSGFMWGSDPLEYVSVYSVTWATSAGSDSRCSNLASTEESRCAPGQATSRTGR